MAVSMRKGVQIGYGQRVLSPKDIANLAAWYDVSDGASLLKSNGSQVTTVGDTVALITDKSGNSAMNALCLNGVAGNYASAPNAAPLQVTGDIDLRCQVAMDSWTPVADSFLISKWLGGGASNSYALAVMNSGVLRLYISTTGADFPFVNSSVAPVVSAYGTIWVRATRVQASGTVTFYTSTDGTQWTQLGTTGTISAGASIFNGTQKVSVGSDDNGTNNRVSGRIYRAQILNGISGTVAFDANFSTVSKLATSFTESSSNAATVTINSSGATGARISGERDLVNLTAASQPTYLPWGGTNYGYLNGVVGNYFSTPDAAPLRITGDIDIRADVTSTTWVGAAGRTDFIGKWSSSTAYLLGMPAGSSNLDFSWTDSGGINHQIINNAATGISANTRAWVRVTLTVATGAVSFYKSTDNGQTWVQIGTTDTSVGATSIKANTAAVTIGTRDPSVAGLIGNIYRAQIYNGINGTLAFDFNPATYVSGTTFLDSSSNAATITLNGGATIVTKTCLYFDGSNDYMKSAAFSLSQPETVYFTGQQVSWILNDTFYDGGSASGRMTIAQSPGGTGITQYAGNATANQLSQALQINFVDTAIFNGSNSLHRINKGTAVTSGNPGTNAANGFTLGDYSGGGFAANITASEILIYSAAQDLTTQNLLITYEGAKWRINVAA